MKPILLVYPPGAGGDFLSGLYVMYMHSGTLLKADNSQWSWAHNTPQNPDDTTDPRLHRYGESFPESVLTSAHSITVVDLSLHTQHTLTHITVDNHLTQHVAELYCKKMWMYPQRPQANDTIANTSDCIQQASEPVKGFTTYNYSELFDPVNNTIPQLLADWGTVVPDQEVLQHVIQYYIKCNTDLLNGQRNTPIEFHNPADIMTELRKVGYV
tara:strand:- start:47 stop:685 length:639 start_codon:yes stop_codon:yes gene_type:complete